MYPTTQPICVHMSSNVRACMSLPACGATPRKGGKGPARSCSCSESPPCPCSVVLVCYLQTQARMKVSHNCARRGRREVACELAGEACGADWGGGKEGTRVCGLAHAREAWIVRCPPVCVGAESVCARAGWVLRARVGAGQSTPIVKLRQNRRIVFACRFSRP